jgi:hypothetical protein
MQGIAECKMDVVKNAIQKGYDNTVIVEAKYCNNRADSEGIGINPR